MISNELLYEIIYVSLKGRLISKDLLVRVAYDVIGNLNHITQSKFNDLRFVDIKEDLGMCYCVKEDGLIGYDYNKIISRFEKIPNYPKLELNLLIIQKLLHEIEHLNEFYKITKNDLQAKLIECSTGEYIMDLFDTIALSKITDEDKAYDYADKLYMEYNINYWDIIPMEKIAEADSFKRILASLDNYDGFDTKYLDVYSDVMEMYCGSLKLGYHYNKKTGLYNAPLLKYLKVLKNIGGEIDLSEIIIPENNYSLEDRLKYGLKVSNDEFNELEKIKLKK